MKTPICNVLSLALPSLVGAVGYYLARTSKGATNMGEALAPFFALAIVLTLAAAVGELAALVSLVRGERLRWLSWMGALMNGVLLMPAAWLIATADWSRG